MSQYNVEGPIQRIEHVKSHLAGGFSINECIAHITNNTGSPEGSTRELARHAEAQMVFEWFVNNDLRAMQQWSYIKGKLQQLIFQMNPDTINAGGKTYGLIFPLLSNHKKLIEWFGANDAAYDMKRVENHKTFDFWAYQALLAIRGEWSRLEKRCHVILGDPPTDSKLKKHINDHYFYLALARGDMEGMQEAMSKIVDPKAVKLRGEADGGYKQDLISTAAVILSKIAWRHGYEINPNSPFVPEEWLPNTPLEKYDLHYSFLKE